MYSCLLKDSQLWTQWPPKEELKNPSLCHSYVIVYLTFSFRSIVIQSNIFFIERQSSYVWPLSDYFCQKNIYSALEQFVSRIKRKILTNDMRVHLLIIVDIKIVLITPIQNFDKILNSRHINSNQHFWLISPDK